MASIRDVARRAGVSTYTVSSVLNESANVSPKLAARVREAVEELDYSANDLARGIFTGKTKSAGMLIPDIGNPFYALVVRGVEDALREHGYSLILGNTYNDAAEQRRYLGALRSKRVEGTIIFAAPGDQSDLKRWVSAQRPIVFIARLPQGFRADAVEADQREGTRMAVEHLIGKGHERIGLIPGQRIVSAGSDRVEGWRLALEAASLRAEDRYIAEANWDSDSGRRAALALLSERPRPTAIFAANFLMMVGVLRALGERGYDCPDEVEVMSSDDSDWLDVFQPAISTVVQPSYEMGKEAAYLLLRRTATPDAPFRRVVLQPSLRLR